MSNSPNVWSVLRLLNWTKDYLKDHGADSPRLDAEVLLANAMGCSRVDLYTRFDYEPTTEQRTIFREAIQKRAKGVPVAYLVGRKEFYSLDFCVDENVLIPRGETEFLMVGLFDAVKELPEKMNSTLKICDVGTGSGNIAITAAYHLPRASVTALDVSPGALAVARKNGEKFQDKIQNRVRFLESDLFSALENDPAEAESYDFIVSNPPYVARTEIGNELEKNVFQFEPHTALFGGERGTELIARFLPRVAHFLKPGGLFFMELSPMIHAEVVGMFDTVPGLAYLRTLRDLDRRERIVVAKRG